MPKQDDAGVVAAEAAGGAAEEIMGVNKTIAPEGPHPFATFTEKARTQPMSAVLSQPWKTTCTAVSNH